MTHTVMTRPFVQPRRTTSAVFIGHGVLVARIENERRLWQGMKDRHTFLVPHSGSWEFLYRGATYLHGPGLVQLKHPGEIYRDLRRSGPTSYDIVLLDPAVMEAARAASASSRASSRASLDDAAFVSPQLAMDDPRAAALVALLRLTDGAGALAIDTAVAEAALALVSLGAPRDVVGCERRAVRRAKAYLLERLTARIRLDEVADHVGLDKFHLIRAFRAEVGVPPYAFVTHARVLRARELLREGMSASGAASAVGFYDQSQLHRHFIKLVGMTPGRYATALRSSTRRVGQVVTTSAEVRC